MTKVLCNGVHTNYHSMGSGKDVVLIHGLAANHAFWNPQILLPLKREYRVTLYDMRGHGYSEMPPAGYTTKDMAEDLHQLLDHLNIPTANLIGHSFGGVVALHYATLYPGRVSSLVIADARVRAFQPHLPFNAWPNWRAIKDKLEAKGIAIPEHKEDSGLWILEQLAALKVQSARQSRQEENPFFIPFNLWGAKNGSAAQWLKLLKTTTARTDFTAAAGLTIEHLAGIKHPALAIYGKNSAALPSFQGLKKHLTNCQTFIIPEAGHFCPLTRPDIFVNQVIGFLSQQ